MLSVIQSHLSHLPLGPIEYHPTIGSTNDLAAEKLAAGAPDLSLVIADEQTAGRGRLGRHWHTPPGSALAFSLILRPSTAVPLWSYAPLAALAIHDALETMLNLDSAIKWPNDVLVGGKKVCGILAEAHWEGDRLNGVVLGMGVNVLPESVPPGELPFPATSVAGTVGRTLDRWSLLAVILEHLLTWREQLGSPGFIKAWEERLAYRGQIVQVGEQQGILAGLSGEGELQLDTEKGRIEIPAGEVSLRPVGT